MHVTYNVVHYEIQHLRTLCGLAGLKAAEAASGHILFQCSICIVSSRLLLVRTFKCTSILALCPEMSENSRVSRAISSFTHMCRGAFWVPESS
jgi:hypothetical protein